MQPDSHDESSPHATVLVVDDNPVNVNLLESMLTQASYDVAVAFSGDEALKIAPRLRPDIILLDVDMPGRSGFETCRVFKNMPEVKDTPVIFVTALTRQLTDGFAAGGVDYVTKPFSQSELIARVATHVDLHRTRADLAAARDFLEERVQERTAELALANTQLEHEIQIRKAVEAHVNHLMVHDMQSGLRTLPAFREALGQGVGASSDPSPYVMVAITIGNYDNLRSMADHSYTNDLVTTIANECRDHATRDELAARLTPDRFVFVARGSGYVGDQLGMAVLRVASSQASGEGARLQPELVADVLPVDATQFGAAELVELAATIGRSDVGSHGEVRMRSLRDLGLAKEDRALLAHIQDAVQHGKFEIWRQPIFRIDDVEGPPDSYEILLRLASNDDGAYASVSTGYVMQLAERFRIVGTLDRWVISKTIQHLESDTATTPYAVNISAQSASDRSFSSWCVDQVAQRPQIASKLNFEITESTAMRHEAHAVSLTRALRSLGCGLAIDDFGVGNTSMRYLKSLSFNSIKIDGVFVADVHVDTISEHLIRSIASIGEALGVSVVAEHVSTMEVIPLLKRLGVTHVQGYAVGHPKPLHATQ